MTDTSQISNINAEQLVIKHIFCDEYLFTIPNYQRPYSWEEEECLTLLDDIHGVAFRDMKFAELPPYFLGSAVIIKKPGYRPSDIVDGQQRLTTLTILLSCLRYKIADKMYKETLSEFIYESENLLKGTQATYRLQTRSRDQNFFNKLIQDEHGLNAYYQNPDQLTYDNDAQGQMLTNAKSFIEAFDKKGYSQEDLIRLSSYIIQKCVIVLVSSTDEEMAFRIFNVLNDRGKDLTISDILKSEILEKIPKKDQSDYTDRWESCEVALGVEKFKDLFSHLRAIYAKKKAANSILSEVREYVKPTDEPKLFIDSVLLPFAKAYSNILNKDFKSEQYAEVINYQFVRLSRVSHTDWMPSAIFYIAKNQNSPEKIKDFLVQLERVTLGMEGMATTLNDRLDRYAKINARIEKNENLYEVGSEFMLSAQDREYIINSMKQPGLYGKRSVKPILAKIEEHISDGSISVNFDGLNIEHILPQNPTSDYWLSKFTAEDRVKLTNSLGNLTLVTVRKNSQAKNYDFPTKVNVYFKMDGKSSNLVMVNKLQDLDEWNAPRIKYRITEMLNYLLQALGLDIIKEEK